MRRLLALAVVIGLFTVMTIQVALASPGDDSMCQPGAGENSELASSWELTNLEGLTELYNGNATAAQATFDFCDKNGDGFVCTMTQSLPNDANGSDTWYLSEDNHYPN